MTGNADETSAIGISALFPPFNTPICTGVRYRRVCAWEMKNIHWMHATPLKRHCGQRQTRILYRCRVTPSHNTWCMYSVTNQRRYALILRIKSPLRCRAACIALTDAVSTRPSLSVCNVERYCHNNGAVSACVSFVRCQRADPRVGLECWFGGWTLPSVACFFFVLNKKKKHYK